MCIRDSYYDNFAVEQFRLFQNAISQIENRGIQLNYKHCCNSAAIAWFKEAYFSHVRSCSSILGHMAMEDGREPIGLKMCIRDSIYGGLANTWDYGPLGVEFKNNVKKAWWRKFVQESKYNVGLDAAILMNPKTWVASGHVGGFADPLIDCKGCKARFRADKLIEEYMAKNGLEVVTVDGWSNEKLENYISEQGIKCPECGKKDFTGIRQFNLMFKTFQGVTEDSKSEIYLRPETAQGIFVNFKNVQRTSRKKIPFGIAQIGKSFRNEITPGNFTFRTREFEQMELEFFCKPGTDLEWFKYWKQ